MKTLSAQLMAALLALTIQADAQAQRPTSVGRVQPLSSVQSYDSLRLQPYYVAPHPYFHGYRPSTAAESYARGVAAMTQAQGQFNRLTAEARVIDTEAQRREIENRELAAETYFAMREANRAARAAERGPRATADDLARFAEQAKPDRLSPSELSLTSGRVSWPTLLQADQFAPLRSELETVFSSRASDGEIGAPQQILVDQVTRAMLIELKQYVRQVNPTDYITARRFLKSLAYEARSPVS